MFKRFLIVFCAFVCLAGVRVTDVKFITIDTWRDVRAYKTATNTYNQAFQAAINAADSGDVIYCNQSFTITDTIEVDEAVSIILSECDITITCNPGFLISVSNVSMDGDNKKAKLDVTTYDTATAIRIYSPINDSLENITISNLYIDGGGRVLQSRQSDEWPTGGTARWDGDGVVAKGYNNDLGTVVYHKNITVKDCYFTNVFWGVVYTWVKNSSIESNKFIFTHDGWGGANLHGSSQCNINDNLFMASDTNCANAIEILTSGLTVNKSDAMYNVVDGNVIYGFVTEAINLYGGNNIISNNTITTAATGIRVGNSFGFEGGGGYNTISNNIITIMDFGVDYGNWPSHGIIISDEGAETYSRNPPGGSNYNTIIGNTVTTKVLSTDCLQVEDNAKYNLIESNKFFIEEDSTDYCVLLYDTSKFNIFRNNYLRGQNFDSHSAGGNFGFKIYDEADSNYFQNNKIDSCKFAFNVASDGNVFTNNFIDYCEYGFYFTDSYVEQYLGNKTTNTTYPGLFTGTTQVEFNEIRGGLSSRDSTKVGNSGYWMNMIDFGKNSFKTTAEKDTLATMGVTAIDSTTDWIFVMPFGGSGPDADSDDCLFVQWITGTADTVVVCRPAGGTSGLQYLWMRIKREL